MFDSLLSKRSRRDGHAIRRFPLRLHVSIIFAGLIFVSLLSTSTYSIVQTRRIIENASSRVYKGILRSVVQQINQISGPARAVVDLMALDDIVTAPDAAARLRRIGSLRAALAQGAYVSAIYVGYRNGDFFIMRKGTEEAVRASFGAPAGTAYIVQAIDRKPDGSRDNLMIFFDATLREIKSAPDTSYDLDPRQRDWFKHATASAETVETDPYVFYATKEIGTTVARRSPDGQAVVGVDLTLKDISTALAELSPTRSAELVLFTADRKVVASNWPDSLPAAATADTQARLRSLSELDHHALWTPPSDEPSGRDKLSFTALADDRDWRVSINRIGSIGELPSYLGIAIPKDELLSDADRIQRTLILVSVAILIISLMAAWLLARRVSRPLRTLADQTRAIVSFDFSDASVIRSRIVEVHELSSAMQSMRATIRRFLEIGRALATESDFAPLLDRMLAEMIDVAQATGGLFYLREEKEDYLRRELVRTRNGPASVEISGARDRIAMDDQSTLVGAIARERVLTHRRMKRADLEPAAAAVASHIGVVSDEVEVIVVPLLD